MRRTGAVRWIAALAVVLCTTTALPGPDGSSGTRFVPGERIRVVHLSFANYPSRQRFAARTPESWARIAPKMGIDPATVDPSLFERRMVVGLVSAKYCESRGKRILGAVRARGGATAVHWRYVEEEICPDWDCASVTWLECFLWSFPQTDRPVRFRRQPTYRIDRHCR